MANSISPDLSIADDLEEKPSLKIINEVTSRLLGKNSAYWQKFYQGVAKLPEEDQLEIIQRFFGEVKPSDLKKILDFISNTEACKLLKLKHAETPIPFNSGQIAEAPKAGFMLSFCPEGLTMEVLQKKCGNRIEGDQKFLYSGDDATTWYRQNQEKFYTTTQSRGGYYFALKMGLPGSANKNYFQQTEMLAEFLLKHRGLSSVPELIDEAIEEFNSQKERLGKLINSDWQQAGVELTALKINQNFRERPVEFATRMFLYRKVYKKYLMGDQYAWLNEFSSDLSVVNLGSCDADGMFVDIWESSFGNNGRLALVPRLQ